MHLLIPQALTFLLATRLLIGGFASPVNIPRATELAPPDSRKLESRASTYAVELAQVGQVPDTFAGVKLMPGLFNIPFTDQQVREATEATFDLWDQKQGYRDLSLLVAVIAVPGYGLAAGTIWHGTDASFAERAQNNAPKLWTLVQRQGRRPGTNRSVWHAEIVASWVAESNFPNGKEGTRWPAGTRIAVYGRETVNSPDGTVVKVTGYKPVCEPGATSNSIACTRLLDAQRILNANP